MCQLLPKPFLFPQEREFHTSSSSQRTAPGGSLLPGPPAPPVLATGRAPCGETEARSRVAALQKCHEMLMAGADPLQERGMFAVPCPAPTQRHSKIKSSSESIEFLSTFRIL